MQEQVTNKLLRVAQDCDDITQAVHDVLVGGENEDIPLTNGTTTPSLNKRIKQYGSQVTSVVGKKGDVTVGDIEEKLELGTAAKYSVTDLMQDNNLITEGGGNQRNINNSNKKKFELFDSKIKAAERGIIPFSLESELLAYSPSTYPVAAKAYDTHKEWIWEKRAPDLQPKWHDSGRSDLDLAKIFSVNNTKQYIRSAATSENIFIKKNAIDGVTVNDATNKVVNLDGAAIYVFGAIAETEYLLYSPSYPAKSFGVWFGYSEDLSDLKVASYSLRNDGYLSINTAAADAGQLFIIVNIKNLSRNFDSTNTLIIKHPSTGEKFTQIDTKLVRDHLLSTNIGEALNVTRTADESIRDYIELPSRMVRLSNLTIQNSPTGITDGRAYSVDIGEYYFYSKGYTQSHLIGTTKSLNLGSAVSITPPNEIGHDGIYRIDVVEKGYLFVTTRIYGVDISSDFYLSKNTNIGDLTIEQIDGEFIRAVNGINDFDMLSENVETKELYNTYIKSVSREMGASSGAKSRVAKLKKDTEYFLYSNLWNGSFFVYGYVDSLSPVMGEIVRPIVTESTGIPGLKKFKTPGVNSEYFIVFNTIIGTTLEIDKTFRLTEAAKKAEEVATISGFPIIDKVARKMIEDGGSGSLEGKNWLCIGDSITERNFRTSKNYQYYIADSVKGLTIYNYGKSGTGYFNRHDVANTVVETDIDLITVFLGTNDWGNQTSANKKQLGAFGDSGTDTISGCINTLLLGLINKFPLVPLAVVMPLPRSDNYGVNAPDNAYGYSLYDLSNMIKMYCDQYSLPFYDFYTKSGLYPWQEESNKHYFTAPGLTEPDGLHPNDDGHKVMARKLKSFLGSI